MRRFGRAKNSFFSKSSKHTHLAYAGINWPQYYINIYVASFVFLLFCPFFPPLNHILLDNMLHIRGIEHVFFIALLWNSYSDNYSTTLVTFLFLISERLSFGRRLLGYILNLCHCFAIMKSFCMLFAPLSLFFDSFWFLIRWENKAAWSFHFLNLNVVFIVKWGIKVWSK